MFLCALRVLRGEKKSLIFMRQKMGYCCVAAHHKDTKSTKAKKF